MAQASRKERKLRRAKRRATLALRMARMALAQRDYARMVAIALEKELQNKEAAETAKQDSSPALTITKVEEDPEVECGQEGCNEKCAPGSTRCMDHVPGSFFN